MFLSKDLLGWKPEESAAAIIGLAAAKPVLWAPGNSNDPEVNERIARTYLAAKLGILRMLDR